MQLDIIATVDRREQGYYRKCKGCVSCYLRKVQDDICSSICCLLCICLYIYVFFIFVCFAAGFGRRNPYWFKLMIPHWMAKHETIVSCARISPILMFSKMIPCLLSSDMYGSRPRLFSMALECM